MKILVIKRDKLGDLLLATPMLAHLKASLPQARVHLLANDYNGWVVDANADIDRRWIYRRVRHAGRVRPWAALQFLAQSFLLRRERFDWVVVANGEHSPRAISLGLSLRGRRCVAYCDDAARYPALTDALPVQRGMHEADRMLAMLAPIGVPPAENALFPRYELPAQSAAEARDWLVKRGLSPGAYIVLGLGARRPKKQPSTAQVLRWSARFKSAWGLDTVFMWTPGRSDDPAYPGDDAVAQPVLDAGAPHIHAFRGPIPQALGLIWGARSSLFPDSGLMHFAAASHGGVLGLFAETDVSPGPAQWAPRGLKADFLEARKSVAELSDALVFERLSRLIG